VIIVIFIALSWWYANQHDDGQSGQALPGTAMPSIAQAPTADTRRYNDAVDTGNSGESDAAGTAAMTGADEVVTSVPEPGSDEPVLIALAGDESMTDANTEEATVAVSMAEPLTESVDESS